MKQLIGGKAREVKPTVFAERDIADLAGEALRRHVYAGLRPLWVDMPEDALKTRWRKAGQRMLEEVGFCPGVDD